ncbi:MAG TPA: mechanosensitive ion channel [Candidatus Omnitrophota bacterium]|nr:mechanosensitive ion channel [Candidatus Omnitrophota bacterium]
MNSFCNNALPLWLYVSVIFLAWLLILQLAKRIIFSKIRSFASQTRTKIVDIFLESINLPLNIVIAFSGLLIIQKTAAVENYPVFSNLLVNSFKTSSIIAFVLFMDKIFCLLIDNYSHRVDLLKTYRSMIKVTVRLTVLAIGLLIVLDSFGISITPILASLGLGSLAIALALQPALENFFSGVQLAMDKPVEIGQFIKLESGEEGFIEKIGWRSTWIRMLPDNMVIIPNKTMVNSRLLNYCYPTKETAVTVEIGVHYNSDLKMVERITEEVAGEVMRTTPGAVSEFKPFIRYHSFGDHSINFTVILRAKEFQIPVL